jgi:cytidylate kinase
MLAQEDAPKHGYRGDAGDVRPLARPSGYTITISREAGARGSSIAKRVSESLGWQMFDQEMLGFLTQNQQAKDELLAETPPEAVAWANTEVQSLIRSQRTVSGADTTELIRLVFILAARGETVLVGRGAGVLLPQETTLNVRIVAPLRQRVAYFAQWQRLTEEEAAKEVSKRDQARSNLHQSFSANALSVQSNYDLILNSGRLGETACAELIVQAIRSKQLTDPVDLDEDIELA